MPAAKKYTIEMNAEMDELLSELASERGLPKSQVIRRAIGLLDYLDDVADSHDIILRSKTDRSEQRLVMESEMGQGARATR